MSKSYSPCSCFTAPAGSTDEGEPMFAACGADTRGTFAPGHDARLKGILLQLIRAGQEYHYTSGGLLVSASPLQVLKDHGWEHFNQPVKERARKSPAEPKAPKAKAGFNAVRVRIGRWVYDATVVAEDVNALTVNYQDRKGNQHVAEVERSQLVAS